MPRLFDVDEICRLLESGANVVATCGQFHHPPSMDPGPAAAVEAACAAGGTSIHSTGSSPGFISEAVPLVMTSIQRSLDNLAIDEYADLSKRDSPEMLFDIMGFGRDLAPFEDLAPTHLRSELRAVAAAGGRRARHCRWTTVTASGEVATRPTRHTDRRRPAQGRHRRGAADHRVGHARRPGAARASAPRGTAATDLEPAWDVRPTGWHVAVDGDAPLDVDIRMPVPLERMAAISPGYTANRAVNASRQSVLRRRASARPSTYPTRSPDWAEGAMP